MSGNNDPYRHHPEIRGKIADPLTSRYRDMDIQVMDERMKALGFPDTWRRSDAEREQCRLATLAGRQDSDLWLFGYGSLIWDPGICFDEVRIGRLSGYHRRFCLRSELGRGSPERPGLMVGLDQGGQCESILFRIPKNVLTEESRRIWQREMLRASSYVARFVPVQTAQGEIEALTFIIDPDSENYMCDIKPEEAAQFVATGSGIWGSSLEYVENLANHLEAFGIRDDTVCTLLERSRQLRQAGESLS
ncbi:MAG: gamma-glutamylcyclotransferase [Burkholderiaceae bacterium]